MDKNKLMDAVGEIDPGFVEEAKPAGRSSTRLWQRIGAAAAALVIIAGAAIAVPKLIKNGRKPNDITAVIDTEAPVSYTEVPADGPTGGLLTNPDMLIAEPDKHEYVQYAGVSYGSEMPGDMLGYFDQQEQWNKALAARVEAGSRLTPIGDFTEAVTAALIDENKDGNVVWSPANVYLALAMLAETTDGETRAQLLDLLGADGMQTLRTNVSAIIEAESNDDGVNKCLIANSVWLNNSWSFYEEILKTLAQRSGASSYWGDPGDPAFSEALRNWLDENTGGMLKEAIKDVSLNPSTVIALASTIYFKSAWEKEYVAPATKQDVFHAPSGDVMRDFMNKRMDAGTTRYYRGSCFIAVEDRLTSGGSAWYLLPDEGVSVADMLANGGMDFINSDKVMASSDMDVILTAPKMDVSSDMDLIKTLMGLGVTDCFFADAADFSPLTPDSDGLYVSKITHAARMKTDEEGLEAAAFTLIQVERNGGHLNEKVLEIKLDRPYVTAVTGVSEAPLFISVVNDPAK